MDSNLNLYDSNMIKEIYRLAEQVGPLTIMEVCGTHTNSIRHYGLPAILPKQIKLVSGPGCPVCVTSSADIAMAVSIAKIEDVIFTCFGDMMRVPSGKESLYSLYEQGKDVRLVTSPMDSLKIARDHPRHQVVYFGIGFETTAPLTAALVDKAVRRGISNLSVLSTHKTMPEALISLLSGEHKVNALLCPGHVAAMIGSDAFSFLPEQLHMPAAISGFEADEILLSILAILQMIAHNQVACVNMYPQVVTLLGNRKALTLLSNVMEKQDTVWRGLGMIPRSGLKLRSEYKEYDAKVKFSPAFEELPEPQGCLCSQMLKGHTVPTQCMHFASTCTPDNPLGPCMVSAEGTCAAYFRYREEDYGF